MAFKDRTLQCADCGSTFVFTTREQEFYASKGYTNDPKRCPSCREARRAQGNSTGDYRGRRQMYPATCAQCGKDCEVPFEPRNGRPVYCSECFNRIRADSQR
ncbi:MAG: zinc-ribbon domain containing protein [Chloroflexota bacterium]|jgi:CxxC-x17-CxxC domain-containing protein